MMRKVMGRLEAAIMDTGMATEAGKTDINTGTDMVMEAKMANNKVTSQTSDVGGEVLKIAKILDGMVKSFRRFWWLVLLFVIIGAAATSEIIE